MVFDHQHHNKGSADRVDDRFKRKYRQPCGIVIRGQECTHRQRHQEDSRMEAPRSPQHANIVSGAAPAKARRR
jgi:hypothetical protein